MVSGNMNIFRRYRAWKYSTFTTEFGGNKVGAFKEFRESKVAEFTLNITTIMLRDNDILQTHVKVTDGLIMSGNGKVENV